MIQEGALQPVLVADGRSLAFATSPSNLVKRVDVEAGSPRTIAPVGGPWHGTWGQQGNGARDNGQRGLEHFSRWRRNLSTAAPDKLQGEFSVGFPEFLSDGRRFLVRTDSELGRLNHGWRVWIHPSRTPRGGQSGQCAARGADTTRQVIPAVPAIARFDGAGVRRAIWHVARHTHRARRRHRSSHEPAVSSTVGVSPSGILAYQTGGVGQSSQLIWVDRAGVRSVTARARRFVRTLVCRLTASTWLACDSILGAVSLWLDRPSPRRVHEAHVWRNGTGPGLVA